MVRAVGPAESQRTIQLLNPRTPQFVGFANRRITLYTDQAGTQLADIRVFDPAHPTVVGAAVTGSVVTLDRNGRMDPFWFPDGIVTLYGRITRTAGTIRLTAGPASSEWFNLAEQGVVPGSSADQTAAIQAAFAAGLTAGYQKFLLPAGDYTIALAEGTNLFAMTGKTGIVVDASGARIINDVLYTGSTFPAIFYLSGCTNVDVRLGGYLGRTLTSPSTEIGVKGAVITRILSGTTGVRARLNNIQWCRYAVQSGDYANEALGGCANLDLDVAGDHIGYPVALYNASSVKLKVYATNVDRAAYLAGIDGIDADVRFAHCISGGDTAVLITDAKTGTGTSRGCANGKIRVRDMGSTTMQTSAMACGISLSRVDPGTTFQNLDIDVHVVATDTVAHRMGCFRINSGATTVPGATYPFDWEQTITLRRIRVSGVIDRSAQTTSSATVGDIYVNTLASSTHYATVSDLTFEDLTIITGVASPITCTFTVPGLADRLTFNRFMAPSLDLTMASNVTSELTLTNSIVKALRSGGTMSVTMINSSATTVDDSVTVFMKNFGATVGGAGAIFRSKQVTLNLTGTSVTWTNAIPAGALVLGVSGVLTQAITGATGFKVGVAADDARFCARVLTAAGSAFTPAHQAGTEVNPRNYLSTTSILVGGIAGATFTAGQIKLTLFYVDFSTPTG